MTSPILQTRAGEMKRGTDMNMIERVARTIRDNAKGQFAYEVVARAVITAMREPDQAMLEAGMKDYSLMESSDSGRYVVTEIYRAMVDAALAQDLDANGPQA